MHHRAHPPLNTTSYQHTQALTFLPQILGDEWDDALIWLARALRYETLLFHATLIGYNDCPRDLSDCRRIIHFKTA